MARFISRRLLLSLITLWLLATIVFFIANVLPNDVGRTILGPFAPQESVDALNERLGTDRPIIVQYVDSIIGVVTLTSASRTSTASRSCRSSSTRWAARPSWPAWPCCSRSRSRSSAGLYAARRRDRACGPRGRAARASPRRPSRSSSPGRSWSSSSASSSSCCRSSRPRRRTPTSRRRSATCSCPRWRWRSCTSATSPG